MSFETLNVSYLFIDDGTLSVLFVNWFKRNFSPSLTVTVLVVMPMCDLWVVLFLKGCWQARARSRAGGCWSWWPSSTWPCCWAAPPSSTSPWASSWLSLWCPWLPASLPTGQSQPLVFFLLHICFAHTSVRPHRPSSSFALQGPPSLRHGHPQPGLHAPLLSVFLPRAAGNARELPGGLDALPVSHLTGDPGPLSLWLTGLPAHCLTGLPVLAAFLEHPLLEVNGGLIGLMKTVGARERKNKKNICSQVCPHCGKCDRWKKSIRVSERQH